MGYSCLFPSMNAATQTNKEITIWQRLQKRSKMWYKGTILILPNSFSILILKSKNRMRCYRWPWLCVLLSQSIASNGATYTIHNSFPKQIRNFSINFKIKSKILPPDFMEPCRVRCKRIRNNFRHFCANFSEKDVQGSLRGLWPPPSRPKDG